MKRILIYLVTLLLLTNPVTVLAQGQTPPQVDPNSVWGEVVDQNGNIRYSNLTDLGTVQQSADWMPSIPGIGSLPASYHKYQAPSGNIVVLPTATTLFFMTLNPQASGLDVASSELGTGAAAGIQAAGIIKGMLQGYIDPASITNMGYTNPDDFFTDVINGKQNIWSVLGSHTAGFLLSLAKSSISDQSLYTTVLLYTPDMCSQTPGGCPQNAKVPTLPPLPPSCFTPVIQKGAVTVTANKIAPAYPLVVGQDAAHRGTDVTWQVRIEPTSYTYGVQVPVMGNVCVPWDGQDSSNCTTSKGKPGMLEQRVVHYNCVQHTEIFPETLKWVTATASLSQSSRDWILNTLSILYPEAYLHHSNFSFAGNVSSGSLQGKAYVWTLTQNHIQVADPGYFDLVVAGATSGTPVSNGRGFSRTGGQFGVWVEESAIIK